MKLMTTNFVQCAVRSCAKTSDAFPLKYSEVQMVQQEVDFDPAFLLGLLPRLDWPSLVQVCEELGNTGLPKDKPDIDDVDSEESLQFLKNLHTLLVETQITEGEMTCRNCGHTYYIKNSIPNFLLPPHLAN